MGFVWWNNICIFRLELIVSISCDPEIVQSTQISHVKLVYLAIFSTI
jgi:hypothetical protein